MCKINGAEVNVYAATSLTDVMKEIASAYEKESGGKILLDFGASSLLERQNYRRGAGRYFTARGNPAELPG